MPKDKDKTLNPAAAHLKSQKASALKKSKAAVAAQRAERLATRNPERIQRRVDELKGMGELRGREKQELERLEREVGMVRKARAERGVDEIRGSRGEGGERGRGGFRGGRGGGGDRGRGRGGSMLGKRRREHGRGDGDGEDEGEKSSGTETDPEVRDIPMPRDTPPPVPPRQYRTRHGRRGDYGNGGHGDQDVSESGPRIPHPLPAKPVAPVAKTTYSSAPQIRDLRKEATAKFVPAAVASKLKRAAGGGGGTGGSGSGLMEPEEADELEKAGYLGGKSRGVGLQGGAERERDDGDEAARRKMEEEEERLERELRELEEVGEEDEGEDVATIARHELRDAGRRDAQRAVDAAVREAEYNMMADEVRVGIQQGNEAENLTEGEKVESELRHVEEDDQVTQSSTAQQGSSKPLIAQSDHQRAALKKAGLQDAQHVAEEMEKEAEFGLMGDEAGKGVSGVQTERRLRLVEIEDVSDDGW